MSFKCGGPAYWADVDTRGGTVSATPGGNSTGSNLVYYDLDEENKIFTVTWDDVGYFSSRTNRLNAFQLQLVAKENSNFDIVYRYEDINWTTGDFSGGSNGLGGTVARAGYSAGNANGYYEMPQSGNEAQMLALDETGKYVFTVRNGITLDDSNNDVLIGGAGDDIIIGGDGHDTAVFSGSVSEYTITRHGVTLTIEDHNLARNGVDTIFSDVEVLKFSDQEVLTNTHFDQVLYVTSSDLFQSADGFSVSSQTRDPSLNSGGYYKIFFALSSASYYHNIEFVNEDYSPNSNLLGSSTDLSSMDAKMHEQLQTMGLHYLTGDEIGISSHLSRTQIDGEDIQYGFSSGYYVATNYDGVDTSSVALISRTSDALFVTFRGSDSGSNWASDFYYDDAMDMDSHYARYKPLFDAIETYLPSSGINKIYVSGHSLGGEMASMYMYEHSEDSRYQAVTFEAANKLLPDMYDDRFLNFEMSGDPVPDLSFNGNYGQTVHLNYEYDTFLLSHMMGKIATQFDLVSSAISNNNSMPLSQSDIRVYVDDNRDGVIETNHGPSYTSLEDLSEYVVTGYRFNTIYDTDTHGSLVLNAIDTISNGTYNLTNDVWACELGNDRISLSENIDLSAQGSNHGVILVGNDANNTIVGSRFHDVLIGNGDEDVLRGLGGDDYLYGSDYGDVKLSYELSHLQSEFGITYQGVAAISDASNGDWVDDVSYLVGGLGKDIMVGSEDDNDYFLVDVNIYDNSRNVDTIKNFFIANALSDPSLEDYLVFSAQQLGVSVDDLDGLWTSTTEVRGQSAAYLSSSSFIVVNGMFNYQLNDGANTAPQFILDKQSGGLYFDNDGSHDVGDQVLLSFISPDSASWTTNLANFDADQILIMNQSAYDLV